jgi:restriction system protein
MAYRGRRKQKKSGLALLFEASWQASAILGVVVFIGLKWFLPAILERSLILKPLAIMFSSVAWLVSGVFFLISVVVYLKSAKARQLGAPAPRPEAIPWPPRSSRNPVQPPLTEDKDLALSSALPACDESSTVSVASTSGKPTEWTIELIRDIEWKRFEDVCQRFYVSKGIRSETTPLGPDGGVDIRLYQDESGNVTTIVQCKAWGDRRVGVKPVRELLGVMTHEKIGKAFFMTSGNYTEEARKIAQSNRITLIDGEMLLTMIKRLPIVEQQELLIFATSGDYQRPTCPTCGTKMKHVAGSNGKSDFWGCIAYPRCRQKIGMRRGVAKAMAA